MKKLTKLLSAICAATMIVSSGLPVYAKTTNHIKVTNQKVSKKKTTKSGLKKSVKAKKTSKKITLNYTKLSLTVGKSKKLQLKNTTKKVKWSSTNKKVVKVNTKGTVKALKKGTAKIKAVSNKKTYTCKVTVKSKQKASKPKAASPAPSVSSDSVPASAQTPTTQDQKNIDNNKDKDTGTNTADSQDKNSDSKADTNKNDEEHTHSWKPVYKTIHHEAEGHYETKTVTTYEQRLRCRFYPTAIPGEACYYPEQYWDHLADDGDNHVMTDEEKMRGGYWEFPVDKDGYIVDTTILTTPEIVEKGLLTQEEAEADKKAMYAFIDHCCDELKTSYCPVKYYVNYPVQKTEQVWVQDKPAYDEKVIDHYKCSICGATKAA